MKHALLALVAAFGCAYPQPKDRCDGDCAVYAIHPDVASIGTTITLEGTFDRDSVVQFAGPNATQVKPTSIGSHRLEVVVPDDAITGGLVVITNTTTTNPVMLRIPTFVPELQPFRDRYEQSDVGRYLGAKATFARIDGASVEVGDHIFLIGGMAANIALDGTVDSMVMNADDTVTEPVSAGVELLHARSGHAAVAIGGYVYAIGGHVISGPTDLVEGAVYDYESKLLGPFGQTPETLSLRTPRAGLAVAVVGNYLYAIGGVNKDGPVAALERAPIYENGLLGDFETISGVKLAAPRRDHTVAVVGNSLYVIGGFDADGAPVLATERFDLSQEAFISDTSTNVGDLTKPHGDHATVVVGDSMYVIGGTDGTSRLATIERTPLSGTFGWQELPTTLRQPRSAAMLASVGNHVYLIGGRATDMSALTTFERASIIGHPFESAVSLDNFSWYQDLPAARAYPTAVVLGDSLYLIGGSDGTGPSTDVRRATIGPAGTFTSFAPAGVLSTPRMGASAFIYNNFLYLAGGSTSGDYSPTDTIERAKIAPDGSLGEFTMQPFKLDQARAYNKAILLGPTAHVIGGMTLGQAGLTSGSETALDQTTIANFSGDTPMMGAHFGYGMLVLPGIARVIAGNNGSVNVDGNESLVSADTLGAWSTSSKNPTHCQGLTVLSLGDTVFAIGGTNGTAPAPQRVLVDAGNGFDGTFMETPSGRLDTPVYGHASVSMGNYVFVLGGKTVTDNQPTAKIEVSVIR